MGTVTITQPGAAQFRYRWQFSYLASTLRSLRRISRKRWAVGFDGLLQAKSETCSRVNLPLNFLWECVNIYKWLYIWSWLVFFRAPSISRNEAIWYIPYEGEILQRFELSRVNLPPLWWFGWGFKDSFYVGHHHLLQYFEKNCPKIFGCGVAWFLLPIRSVIR